mgnify:CR=1 FL=1
MYGWKANAIFPYDESNAFTPDWKQLTPIFDEKDRFTGYELDGKAYDGEIKQYRYNTATGDVSKAVMLCGTMSIRTVLSMQRPSGTGLRTAGRDRRFQ